jgi:diguanylate cyclase (GGDEF)-like protein
VAIGLYGFLAAAQSRRAAINMERKLRLGLLVHNMELENMAMRDELTQLFNRRYFFDRLERELETARGFQRPLAVMVADIDGMREINSIYGYRTGDDVLAAFGGFVLGCIRGSDVPARIGSDEFAIILPDTPEGAAGMLMDRLMQRLAEADLMQDHDLSLQVSASFGVSGYPWGGQTVDAIVQAALGSMRANQRARHIQSGFQEEAPAENGIPSIFLRDADPE